VSQVAECGKARGKSLSASLKAAEIALKQGLVQLYGNNGDDY
jgi:hypothetical protein